jgi:hypothetical protein
VSAESELRRLEDLLVEYAAADRDWFTEGLTTQGRARGLYAVEAALRAEGERIGAARSVASILAGSPSTPGAIRMYASGKVD